MRFSNWLHHNLGHIRSRKCLWFLLVYQINRVDRWHQPHTGEVFHSLGQCSLLCKSSDITRLKKLLWFLMFLHFDKFDHWFRLHIIDRLNQRNLSVLQGCLCSRMSINLIARPEFHHVNKALHHLKCKDCGFNKIDPHNINGIYIHILFILFLLVLMNEHNEEHFLKPLYKLSHFSNYFHSIY